MSDVTAPGNFARTSTRPTLGLRDALTMAGRSLRLSRRNVEALLTSVALPIMLMLLFVYLLGSAIHTGTRYVTYVVPGVLLLCAGFGSATTAVSVSQDTTGGIIDRFRSLDVGGAAVLAGHVAASVVRNAVSTVLVLGVAFLIGFRPNATALGWAAAGAILLVFIVAISWLSAAAGLLATSPEAASGFTFFVIFLPYPSSAFAPIATMPGWIHGFAHYQPATPIIGSIRGLPLHTAVGDTPGGRWPGAGGLVRRHPRRRRRGLRRAFPPPHRRLTRGVPCDCPTCLSTSWGSGRAARPKLLDLEYGIYATTCQNVLRGKTTFWLHDLGPERRAGRPEEIAGDQRATTVDPAPGLSGYVFWPILRSLRRSPAICSRHADVT